MLKGFKPCYKWNTFNTERIVKEVQNPDGFKPCYKWNTFNTANETIYAGSKYYVLNLVISGIPSIQRILQLTQCQLDQVLNLVISGIPSILVMLLNYELKDVDGFKPCYKWNTFNTINGYDVDFICPVF